MNRMLPKGHSAENAEEHREERRLNHEDTKNTKMVLIFSLFASSVFSAPLRFKRFPASEEGMACHAAFVVEQPAFDVKAPSIAGQAAVAAEDAMAGHDD